MSIWSRRRPAFGFSWPWHETQNVLKNSCACAGTSALQREGLGSAISNSKTTVPLLVLLLPVVALRLHSKHSATTSNKKNHRGCKHSATKTKWNQFKQIVSDHALFLLKLFVHFILWLDLNVVLIPFLCLLLVLLSYPCFIDVVKYYLVGSTNKLIRSSSATNSYAPSQTMLTLTPSVTSGAFVSTLSTETLLSSLKPSLNPSASSFKHQTTVKTAYSTPTTSSSISITPLLESTTRITFYKSEGKFTSTPFSKLPSSSHLTHVFSESISTTGSSFTIPTTSSTSRNSISTIPRKGIFQVFFTTNLLSKICLDTSICSRPKIKNMPSFFIFSW